MISEQFQSHFNPQPSPLETIQPTLDLIEQIANQDTLGYLASQQEQEVVEPEQESVEEAKPSRKRSKPVQEEILSA